MEKKTLPITYNEIGETLEKFIFPIGGSFKIFDNNMEERYSTTTNPSPVCNIITKKVPQVCQEFIKEMFQEAKKSKEPFTEKCPIGKLVFVIPLRIEETFIGAAIGSIGFASFSRRRRRTLIEIAKKANIAEDKILKIAENEFLNRKYAISEHHKDVFFREIKGKDGLINILNRFMKTLEIKIALKKIKPECRYTYDIANAIEYIVAGNFSQKENIEGTTEEKLILQLIELAKETCRELLEIAMSESIRWKAYHDNLTGLYNRYVLDEEIKKIKELKIAPVAFILVDMDNLKKINDKYGHEMGDKAIYAVGQALKSAVRRNDVVTRIGGDEFVILLPGISEREAKEIISRIEQNVKNARKDFQLPFDLTVSIGYEIIEHPEEADEAIIKADKKMYSCKKCKKEEQKD
ncbi:diguanylate cyclase domain-containing protein [Desulfurobacterium atlanticum]|uniref:diguanylate cyclase n=1 Tax=Desulfurobacterium atlanticum TaxID=240169 RepID=A0A238ZG96_9BACT|nr:diguanylate cyclase [Desulfurobacterium atlanticum]SNR82300.1 diguanylate cyclase (GGDEF) domain-containing protein [Desulfurobacterium atlanticum]